MAEPIELNEIIKAYAEKKGITPTDAMLEFKKNFVHRSEISDTALNSMKPYNIPGARSSDVLSEDLTHAVTESSRVELKRLEIESRRIVAEEQKAQAEQRKQDYLEKKLEMETNLQRDKLDREEKLQRDKLDREEKQQREKLDREEKLQQRRFDAEEQWKREQLAVEKERAALERQIMLQNMAGSGKKPDELIEVMKSQSGMALEMVKSQAAGTEKMYQTLLDQKNTERDREMEIKTALAKIEAERDVKLGELKQEADAETATQMQMLVDKMEEKFGPKIEKMPSSAESFINQMQEYKKMQDQFLTLTFDTLEARGFDKDQISIMKKAAKIEEQKQDTTVDKVWEVGKKIWKDYVEPNIDKAQRELSSPPPAPSQQQQYGPTPEQVERQRRFEADQQEQIRIETLRKQEENTRLHAQVEQERNIHAQRQHLEDRAAELGIAVDPSMTDRQISDLIVRQEFILDQGMAQREKLDAHAISIGITPDPSSTNEQLFDIIEHRESEIEQHRKSEIKQFEKMKKEQEAEVKKPTLVTTQPHPQEIIVKSEVPTVAQTEIQSTPISTPIPVQAESEHTDIKEELIEISKETEEFLSSQGQGQTGEHRVVQVAEIKEVADMPIETEPPKTDEVYPEQQPEPEPEQDKKKKTKGRKKQDRQDKLEKQPNTYHIVREDGEPIGDVEAKNPHGAAMKAARITDATDEAPITLKISGGGLEQDQTFKVSMVEVMNRGKKTQVAKAERLKV